LSGGASDEATAPEETEQAEETAPAAIDEDEAADEAAEEPRAEAAPRAEPEDFDEDEDAGRDARRHAAAPQDGRDRAGRAAGGGRARDRAASPGGRSDRIAARPRPGGAVRAQVRPVAGGSRGGGRAAAASARRDLLPDIDEINSTLRSDADRGEAERGEADDGAVGERRRGFRLGFGLMILLAAGMIGLYLASGWLAATVPALEPFLIAYVAWANGLAAWLDGLLAAGVDGLSALTGNAAPEA
jgi:hypothetical protein